MGSTPSPATIRIKLFETCAQFEDYEVKAVEVKDGNVTVDFQDVEFSGLMSTFGNTDRDGDVVKAGAFKDTLRAFRKNPIMLIDHFNSVRNVAGSYTDVRESDKGLAVTGKISNSPEMRHVRFLVKEGHLKTLSMGGIFHFEEDGRSIFRVDLWEGSLVAIPANPKATFVSKDIDDEAIKTLASKGMLHLLPSEFLPAAGMAYGEQHEQLN